MNNDRDQFSRTVSKKIRRKLRAHSNPHGDLWFGLGMIGLIGWSVVVPTLLGAALGQWIDRTHGSAHQWTLALLVGGLVIGCLNAWHWVSKEEAAINESESEDPDE
jgi:ATP synthase protein I